MEKVIDGVKFFTAKSDNRALVAYETPEEAETIRDAKFLAEDLLEKYVAQESDNGYWSIQIDSKDGHTVDVSWKVEGDSEEGDEFIKTVVDGELLNDRNSARHLRETYKRTL